MSLDVYLLSKTPISKKASSGIFIRENGQTKEITEEEWNIRNPDKEPVKFIQEETETLRVYTANITHNLGTMAKEAGIYEALWKPYRLKEVYNILENDYETERQFEITNETTAKDIIPFLEKGLFNLKEKPEHFKTFNSENGWGIYENFVPFVENYLQACKEYPDAVIETSR